MAATDTKLTAAVEAYFADLRRVRASGGATGERSAYGPLASLLNTVGSTLKPKVFCVGELADQGAGHPDFGLYTAKQVQKGQPRKGQMPERGVVEVKSSGEDMDAPGVRDPGLSLLGLVPVGAGNQPSRVHPRRPGRERR